MSSPARSTESPRIALTPGEPAGIGPELMAALAAHRSAARLVIIGSLPLIRERCALAGRRDITFTHYEPGSGASGASGQLCVLDVPLAVPSRPGRPDRRNGPYVLSCLERACAGCLSGEFGALVTGPVSKAVLDSPQTPFTGHTEFLQRRCGVSRVVMMLGCAKLKVALCTTHLPLRDVPSAITPESLKETVRILYHDLRQRFGIAHPLIAASGLNPHAGEEGHLGREEIDVIIPALEELRAEGIGIEGPYPADTMFQPELMARADAFLCMYHDQGLPVLKYAGFDEGYNITLGLPFVRVSVDHGTAYSLAGTGKASPNSLFAAVDLAIRLAGRGR